MKLKMFIVMLTLGFISWAPGAKAEVILSPEEMKEFYPLRSEVVRPAEALRQVSQCTDNDVDSKGKLIPAKCKVQNYNVGQKTKDLEMGYINRSVTYSRSTVLDVEEYCAKKGMRLPSVKEIALWSGNVKDTAYPGFSIGSAETQAEIKDMELQGYEPIIGTQIIRFGQKFVLFYYSNKGVDRNYGSRANTNIHYTSVLAKTGKHYYSTNYSNGGLSYDSGLDGYIRAPRVGLVYCVRR